MKNQETKMTTVNVASIPLIHSVGTTNWAIHGYKTTRSAKQKKVFTDIMEGVVSNREVALKILKGEIQYEATGENKDVLTFQVPVGTYATS